MKILIIAKAYHQGGARAIQLKRTINALLKYSRNSIILITHGPSWKDQESINFRIINIESNFKTSRIKNRLFNATSNFDKHFIDKSTQIAEKICITENISNILTVSTPFECHEVGLRLKNKWNFIRWNVFLSDLWPAALLPIPYKRNYFRSSLDIKYLKNILTESDFIITTSIYTKEILKQTFNDISEKIASINHISNNLEMHIKSNRQEGYFVHSGYLQNERIHKNLVIAIKELELNPEFKGLIHIGRYGKNLLKLIKKYDCKKFFLLGNLPEDLAVKIQEIYACSLIIEAPMKIYSPFLPSKITDAAIYSDKIICITPKNSMLNDFASKYNGIYTSSYEKDEIVEIFSYALSKNEKLSSGFKAEFNPENVVKQYVQLLFLD